MMTPMRSRAGGRQEMTTWTLIWFICSISELPNASFMQQLPDCIEQPREQFSSAQECESALEEEVLPIRKGIGGECGPTKDLREERIRK
jgi:hypothetical protein